MQVCMSNMYCYLLCSLIPRQTKDLTTKLFNQIFDTHSITLTLSTTKLVVFCQRFRTLHLLQSQVQKSGLNEQAKIYIMFRFVENTCVYTCTQFCLLSEIVLFLPALFLTPAKLGGFNVAVKNARFAFTFQTAQSGNDLVSKHTGREPIYCHMIILHLCAYACALGGGYASARAPA